MMRDGSFFGSVFVQTDKEHGSNEKPLTMFFQGGLHISTVGCFTSTAERKTFEQKSQLSKCEMR